jgi:hypothetical protein
VGAAGVVVVGVVVVPELELDPPVDIGEIGEIVGYTAQASYFLY